MTRPIAVNDFMDSLNLTNIWSLLEKGSLGKIFRRVVGKSLLTNATSVTSTGLVDVAGLTFNVRKGQKYRLEGCMLTLGSAVGGVKFSFTVSGQTSPTVVLTGAGVTASTLDVQRALSGGVIYTAAGIVLKVDINGYYIPDANGVAQLQWNQNTTNGTSTLYAGSWLKLIRVG